MRFRPHLRNLAWVTVAMCLLSGILQTVSCFRAGRHSVGDVALAGGWLILAALGVFYCLFVYWDLNLDGLSARVFWKVRKIPWQSVRSVSKFGFGTDDVIIRFGHSVENYGNLIATPANREEFIATLRKFAPRAEFKE
jgi:hypothetical protein